MRLDTDYEELNLEEETEEDWNAGKKWDPEEEKPVNPTVRILVLLGLIVFAAIFSILLWNATHSGKEKDGMESSAAGEIGEELAQGEGTGLGTGPGANADAEAGAGTDVGTDSGEGKGTGVGSGTEGEAGTGTGTGTEGEAGTGTGSGTAGGAGTGTGSGTEAGGGTGTGAGTEGGAGTGTGAGTAGEGGAGTGSGTEAGGGTGTGSGAEGGAGAGSGTEAGGGTEAGSGTGAASGAGTTAGGGGTTGADNGMVFTACQDTVTPKDVINLRSAPSTGEAGNIVTQAVNGETLTRTGINNDTGWSRLDYNGQTLYAVSRYLTTDLAYQPPAATADPNTVSTKDGRTITFTNCDDNVSPKIYVNLRLEPSTSEGNATVYCGLDYGLVVHRTGISEESGWSRVEYDGQILYVVTSYIYVVEEQAEE